MSQMPQQLLVAEFMQKLGRITLPEKLRTLTHFEVKLCKALIEEEFIKELTPALDSNDQKAIIDAVMDSFYVLHYTLNLMGFYETVEAFEVVHRSNMTKLWTLREWSEQDQIFQLNHVMKVVDDIKEDKSVLVMRKCDGKIIKSPSYTPVDFSELLK